MRQADGELILFWTLPMLAVLWISAFFLFPGFVHPMSPSMTAQLFDLDGRSPRTRSRITT